MSHDEMRRLFEDVLTAPPPDLTDIEAAVRDGRRRRRRRTATVLLSSAGVLAASGIVLAGTLPTSGPQPPVSGANTLAVASPPTAEDGNAVTSARELLGTWWTVQLDGTDVADVRDGSGNPLYLRFGEHPGQLWWLAGDGCNDHSGRYTVSSAARFTAEAGTVTLVACIGGSDYPRNPAAVLGADAARIVPATATTARRLVLLSKGNIVAVYMFQPDADPKQPARTVLTSGPSDGAETGEGGEVTGTLTVGTDNCLGLDGRSAVFPQGTSWAPALGLLILPDGSTARIGDTITGNGRELPAASARTWVHDPTRRDFCSWTTVVNVFDKGSTPTSDR